MNKTLLIGAAAVAAFWLYSRHNAAPPPSRPGIDISLPGAGITVHMSQPNQPNAGVSYDVTQTYQ